ncbi:hypothetical protein PCE1_004163 [Barthelona sp. PCE]
MSSYDYENTTEQAAYNVEEYANTNVETTEAPAQPAVTETEAQPQAQYGEEYAEASYNPQPVESTGYNAAPAVEAQPMYGNAPQTTENQPVYGSNQGEGNSGFQNQNPNYTRNENDIYVGNLSFDCQESDLQTLFAKYGKLVRCNILVRPDGRSRGFGFIRFENREAGERAISELNRTEFLGRALHMDFDSGDRGRSRRRTFSKRGGGRGGYNNRRGGYGGGRGGYGGGRGGYNDRGGNRNYYNRRNDYQGGSGYNEGSYNQPPYQQQRYDNRNSSEGYYQQNSSYGAQSFEGNQPSTEQGQTGQAQGYNQQGSYYDNRYNQNKTHY